MLRKWICLFGAALFANVFVTGQNKQTEFRAPMDVPMHLSGTFGEFRANHFHSGIDIRTGGVEGLPVYAIADGYVSRVVVSPVGFGKALYVDHPSTGHTSVYAHLQRFSPRIAAYVRNEQYQRESFAVNLSLEPSKLPIKKGEVIGFSGNSGSSGGPHLHFEIRDAATQHILNPLAFGFKYIDNSAPVITMLAVYPEDARATVQGRAEAYFTQPKPSRKADIIQLHENLQVSGPVSFGLGAYDQSQGAVGRNGIYQMELMIDSLSFFVFSADRFSFDDTRYVNSLTDFDRFQYHNQRLVRTKKDPMNRLRFLVKQRVADGVFFPEPGRTYRLKWVVSDFAGNHTTLVFNLVGQDFEKAEVSDTSEMPLFKAGRRHVINGKGFTAFIPEDALYRDEKIPAIATASKTALSDVLSIGHKGIPLHRPTSISIEPYPSQIPHDKLLIVRLESGKPPSPLQSKYEKGRVSANTTMLGEFAVMADTLAPVIKPLNFVSGLLPDTLKSLRFEVKDDFSGINTIRATINGNWILTDHDPKNNLLTYEIDNRLLTGKSVLRISVTDQQGNLRVLQMQIEKR